MIFNATLAGVLLLFFVFGVLLGYKSKTINDAFFDEEAERIEPSSSVVDYRLKFVQDITAIVAANNEVLEFKPQELIGSTINEITHYTIIADSTDAIYDFYIHWKRHYFVSQVSYIGEGYAFVYSKQFRFYHGAVNKVKLMRWLDGCDNRFEREAPLSPYEISGMIVNENLTTPEALQRLFRAASESLTEYNKRPSKNKMKLAVFLNQFCIQNYRKEYFHYLEPDAEETPLEKTNESNLSEETTTK